MQCCYIHPNFAPADDSNPGGRLPTSPQLLAAFCNRPPRAPPAAQLLIVRLGGARVSRRGSQRGGAGRSRSLGRGIDPAPAGQPATAFRGKATGNGARPHTEAPPAAVSAACSSSPGSAAAADNPRRPGFEPTAGVRSPAEGPCCCLSAFAYACTPCCIGADPGYRPSRVSRCCCRRAWLEVLARGM